MISVIVPFHNACESLSPCLEALFASNFTHFECIAVDDGSSDGSSDIVARFPTVDCQTEGGPLGPAHARNVGALQAKGEYLFFIDADVMVRPDTLSLIAEAFESNPDATALFGSYDDDPLGAGFLTQYKNLVHHFVHQEGNEDASTFWTGCGAVRRELFLEIGGFDGERYPRPSIEDIELGYRMKAAGHRILLRKEIQVKHLKNWSLVSLVKTDVFSRALPWTRLILQAKSLPNDLNLQSSQRVSSALLGLLLLFLAINLFRDNVILLPLLTGLYLLSVDGWHWRQRPVSFRPGQPTEFISYGLIAVVALVGFLGNLPALSYVVALVLLAMFAARLSAGSTPNVNRSLFYVMMLILAAGFALLVVQYPVWFIVPVMAILTIIVLLNLRLYSFFRRQRGISFAVAVLPLQLLYYFYSTLTFAVSSGLHLWNGRLRVE